MERLDLSGVINVISIHKSNCESVYSLTGSTGNIVNMVCDYEVNVNRDNFYQVFFWMIALVVIFLFFYKCIIWAREFFS